MDKTTIKNSSKKKKVVSYFTGGGNKSKTNDFVSDELSFNSFFDGILFNETIVPMSRLYTFEIEKSHYKNFVYDTGM